MGSKRRKVSPGALYHDRKEVISVTWRLIEWGSVMGALCWLFVRMWTDSPTGGAGRVREGRRRPADKFLDVQKERDPP
jgi:hypothetical protein